MTTRLSRPWLAAAFIVCTALACPSGSVPLRSASSLDLPSSWQVTASALADVTGDDVPEWVLLVWRPWEDWPIQRWSAVPSPIARFHDAAGASCHLILIDPRDGREIWAGSALPRPFLALAVQDVDEDGVHEVVTLEGDYARGRQGPGTHIDVWSWSGFGFALDWRSPPGAASSACLSDVPSCLAPMVDPSGPRRSG